MTVASDAVSHTYWIGLQVAMQFADYCNSNSQFHICYSCCFYLGLLLPKRKKERKKECL
jgi:hypothetical protein